MESSLLRRALLLIATACGGPPAAGADAPLSPDSATVADARPVDAPAADDASPDGPPADAAACAVAAQPGDNPYRITLTDVTGEMGWPAGIAVGDSWSFGAGVALVDVEPDGDLDVILARPDIADSPRPGGPTLLLRNQGPNAVLADLVPDDAFTALTTGHEIHGVAAGDVDRDGDIDLFFAAVGRDLFLRNDGGAFVDATLAAGVGGPIGDRTSQGVFADLNGDGALDLFVVAQAPTWPPEPDWRMENRLYLNKGDGTFRDVTAEVGGIVVAGRGSSHTALIADLDGDPAPEIYVVNDRFSADGEGGNIFLDPDQVLDPGPVNELGRPYYGDRGAAFGVEGRRSSMGAALADVDFDGDDDLYVTDIGRKHLQLWDPLLPGYREDLVDSYELALRFNGDPNHRYVSWGARFLDLDRDGWLELFLVNGGFTYFGLCLGEADQRDLFVRSSGPGAYVDITGAVGLPGLDSCPAVPGEPQSGRGLATGDLDGDGDDDLVVSPYSEAYRFYRNDTPACPRWRLRVRPRGTVSAPDPVGTVLTVELADGRTLRRTLYAGGDPYSQSDRVLEVGLRDTTLVRADLQWPSGIRQRIDRLPSFQLDAEMMVSEPDWLHVGALAVPFPGATEIVYRPVDEEGRPLGPGAAGRSIVAVRSDGYPVSVIDLTDGAYRVPLVHMGFPRPIVVTITEDGVELPVRPVIEMQ